LHEKREKNLRKIIPWLVIATIILTFASVHATPPSEMVRAIIVFKEKQDIASVRSLGGEVITTYRIIPGLAARVPERALEELRKNPAVAYVEPDGIVHVSGQQVPWGITRIGAPSAWSSSTGAGIKVAILDTGIQYDHPDLAANIKGGISVVGDENSTDNAKWDDGHWHGTHVAGIVAAINNDIGVVGVAPAAWLYAVKVLADNGEGYISDVIEGMDWCVQNGMQVLNMSLGTASDVLAFKEACDKAYADGILLVAAAGNEDDNGVLYPAKYESVIAVAATDAYDNVPSWSSRGPEVELAAPGVNILSTSKGSNYAWADGTSMASPHVAGTAALIWAKNPGLTNVLVRSILQQTAQDLGPVGKDNVYGYGLVMAPEYGVDVSVLPEYQSGLNGQTLNYTVTVVNAGNASDTYDLSVNDSLGWSPSVSPTSLAVPAGENRTSTLSVTIPDNAVGSNDNIAVTASSQADNTVSDSDSCVATSKVGRVKVSSPYKNYPYWFKGNLHSHTENSDGSNTAYEMMTAYRTNGYSLNAITDHRYLTNSEQFTDLPYFLGINGEEVGYGTHMLAIGIENLISSSGSVIDWVDNVLSQGGIAIPAHPAYFGWTLDSLRAAVDAGARGMEIHGDANTGPAAREMWDTLLSENRLVYGFMNDDAHSTGSIGRWGWNVVNAESLNKENVLKNLKEGNFYCVQSSPPGPGVGPQIDNIIVENENVIVITSPGEYVLFIGDNGILLENKELVDNKASYIPAPWVSYVRMEVYGGGGVSYTQPLSVSFEEPKAEFSLVTIYKVGLDVDLQLENGSKLVVKFYTYGCEYRCENVVWEGTTPAHVAFVENVPHPENRPVEKVTLVLTMDNTEDEISTITSFVVTVDDLWTRLGEISSRWPYAPPGERDNLWKEIADLSAQWSFAP